MIVHDVVQGSPEWMRLRLGVPTGSNADRIITPKSRKPSASQAKYRAELLAEWLIGHPVDVERSGWMERGTELEGEARAWYEFDAEEEVEEVGFVTTDSGLVGGSPDGLVGTDGILEIKCPAAHTHVFYMLGEDPDYTGQVQWYMWLLGREWTDVLSYNPALPAVVSRVHRDEEYISALTKALEPFVDRLERDKERLKQHRKTPPWEWEPDGEEKE